MNRRRFLGVACSGALPSIAGCITDPGVNGGLLELFEESAPPNATVTDASNERIRELDLLQDGFEEVAKKENAAVEVEVPEDEYDAVAQTLSELPFYDRVEHDGNHLSGIYVRYEGTEIVVVLTPFCTDSPIIRADSERGEYGWGGCYDRGDGILKTHNGGRSTVGSHVFVKDAFSVERAIQVGTTPTRPDRPRIRVLVDLGSGCWSISDPARGRPRIQRLRRAPRRAGRPDDA